MKSKNVELQRELVFKDGKVYAYIGVLNEYEQINGCEYFAEKVQEQKELENKRDELLKQIAEFEKELQLNKKEQLALEQHNYCPVDATGYDRVGGVVVGEYKTHRKECQHKGE